MYWARLRPAAIASRTSLLSNGFDRLVEAEIADVAGVAAVDDLEPEPLAVVVSAGAIVSAKSIPPDWSACSWPSSHPSA